MVSYLQNRGIDPDLIGACIKDGTLYESRRYHNCVFVGRDLTGRARFACLRGTQGSFRMDVEGSDKRYNFSLPAADPKCPRLAVAESPIDALSLAALVKLSGGDWQSSHYILFGETSGNDAHSISDRLSNLPPEQFEIAADIINKLFEAFASSGK